jgi:hypothetical protein
MTWTLAGMQILEIFEKEKLFFSMRRTFEPSETLDSM